MKEQIPVNPAILVWARKTAGISVEDAARRMNKESAVIESWESGDDTPTYIQLEKLAYQIYKRPLALFFFPEPPEEESPEQSFRTLPEQETERMSSRMKILIRKARVMQQNLYDLNGGLNQAEKQIIKDINFKVRQPIAEMADEIRTYLGVALEEQVSWPDTDSAFKYWRKRIEKFGIHIFKDAFRDDAISGFCLYDDEFPVIYINNSKPITRQIFTLFHELAHLLFRTGGVDKRLDDYIDYLTGDERTIEIVCNHFAGTFLVPDDDFDTVIKGVSVDDTTLQVLAEHYKISREVILRKFLDRKIINNRYYTEKVRQWADSTEDKKGDGSGNYYNNMGVYLSQKYMELAFSHYYKKNISATQLADYLGIKMNSIPGMENIMMARGTAA